MENMPKRQKIFITTMEKIINIMIGLPGSGKSHFCRTNATEAEDHWISRDAIRFSILKPGQSYYSQETNVFNTFIDTINNILAEDADTMLYIDATHINASSRLKLLRRLNLTGDEEINYYFFDTPIEECLRRNRGRTGMERVPDTAIRDMNARAQFFITDSERRAYNPTEYRVNWKGEVEI